MYGNTIRYDVDLLYRKKHQKINPQRQIILRNLGTYEPIQDLLVEISQLVISTEFQSTNIFRDSPAFEQPINSLISGNGGK